MAYPRDEIEATIERYVETRKVIDVRRAMMYLALRGDVSKEDVLACMSMTIGDLEEKVRLRRKCTWQTAKDIMSDTLSSVVEKKAKKAPLIRK